MGEKLEHGDVLTYSDNGTNKTFKTQRSKTWEVVAKFDSVCIKIQNTDRNADNNVYKLIPSDMDCFTTKEPLEVEETTVWKPKVLDPALFDGIDAKYKCTVTKLAENKHRVVVKFTRTLIGGEKMVRVRAQTRCELTLLMHFPPTG